MRYAEISEDMMRAVGVQHMALSVYHLGHENSQSTPGSVQRDRAKLLAATERLKYVVADFEGQIRGERRRAAGLS